MSNRSTSKDQFLAEIEEIRQLRRRYWISMIAIPLLLVIGLVAAEFIHPIFIILLAVPLVAIRIYSIKLGLAKCPRCGEHFNGNPRKPLDRRSPRLGWGILETGSRCVNCDFPL